MNLIFKVVFFFYTILNFQNFIYSQDQEIAEKFGHEIEETKSHSDAKFLKFNNGFRVVLYNNINSQENKIYLYLMVKTGSLNETVDQIGVAHFVEHMAFNGTLKFPKQSLIAFFNKVGMSFGADVNAFTSHSYTVYKVCIPNNKLKEEALDVLKDIATNITFLPEEIEKEKGVILSEYNLRTSQKQSQSFIFNHQWYPEMITNHLVIGTPEKIKLIDKDKLVSYYNQWYRPAKMTLVIVGNLWKKEKQEISWVSEVQLRFKYLKSKLPPIEETKIKCPEYSGDKINVLTDPSSESVTFELATILPIDNNNKKFKDAQRAEILNNITEVLLSIRLKKVFPEADQNNISCYYEAKTNFNTFYTNVINVKCKNEKWSEVFSEIISAKKNVIENGFSDEEFEKVKKDYLEKLEKVKKVGNKITNEGFADIICNSIKDQTPFLGFTPLLDLDIAILNKISKDDVHKNLKSNWLCDHLLINITGNLIKEETESKILKILEDIKSKEAIDPVQNEVKANISSPFEVLSNDKIIDKELFEKLNNAEKFPELKNNYHYIYSVFAPLFGLWSSCQLKNNIDIKLKRTARDTDTIYLNILFGWGEYTAPKDKPGLTHVANYFMQSGGLINISNKDLNTFLDGKKAKVNFSVEPNCFQLQVTTNKEDLELALQHCRAKILTPGFREDSIEMKKEIFDKIYLELQTNVFKNFMNSFMKTISNNNFNYAYPDRNVLDTISILDVKNWLTSEFKKGPMEIDIVGDFDEFSAAKLIVQYFSDLPVREKFKKPLLEPLLITDNFEKIEHIDWPDKKAFVVQVYRLKDSAIKIDRPSFNFIAHLLNERVRLEIRENLGLSYSPSVSLELKPDYLDSNYLILLADTQPDQSERVKNSFDKVIAEFLKRGVTDQELHDIKLIIKNKNQKEKNTHLYWLNYMLNSRQNPKNVGLTIDECSLLNKETINSAAKKCLNLKNKSTYIYLAQPKDNK